MLTTDRTDPDLKVTEPSGMQKKYLVLSEEERAKGFVRPVRQVYKHVGKMPRYKGVHRMLDKPEKAEYQDKMYVAIMTVLTKENGSFLGGAYVDQKELDAWESGSLIGGCQHETRMGLALSETYARDPKFYGATFCSYCGDHYPVGEYGEFIWLDGERVGS